jgi:tRNA(His) guanylyltransferase
MQIGDRMKHNYEKAYNTYLPYRMPVIIRVDGKNFHSFTKDMHRPFDEDFIDSMGELAAYLVEQTHTAQFAYVQSDEISILLHNYKKLDTQPYFANEIQKVASITAGFASSFFSLRYGRSAVFDARCFVIPEDEVVNYFIWRQQDATRNSISMLAQSLFAHKELHKKSGNDMQEMMWKHKDINWNDLPVYQRRGLVAHRTTGGKVVLITAIPKFTEDRNFINRFLEVVEE